MRFEIVVDAHETPNKCTITPLAFRSDFRLFPVFGEGKIGPLSAPLLLHHEGECLTNLRQELGRVPAIASIDCVWRRVAHLVAKTAWVDGVRPRLARIPDGFCTAYPRVGSPSTDPATGLATIEALFIAAALVGHYDPTLLARYYFAERFIEINLRRFLDLGVGELADRKAWPTVAIPPRNAQSRRRNRGRSVPTR